MRWFRTVSALTLASAALSACPGPEVVPPTPDAGLDAPAVLDAPTSDTPTPADAGSDTPDAAVLDVADPCANPDVDGDGADSMACGGIDCDDADPLRAPGRPEICDTADRDEDCDATTYGVRDADMDGEPDARCCNVSAAGARTCGTDCDDVRAAVSPVAPEVCNGRDDDCNVAVDEGVETTYYLDGDGDGFGVSTMTMLGCTAPPMYVATGGDCVDSNRDINPARGEVCGNLIDDNCNMMTDETGVTTFYADLDGDMHGDPAAPMSFPACSAPVGWAVLGGDCDDGVATTYEGAPELCNRVDDDCSLVGGRGGPDPAEDTDADGHAEIGLCSGGPLPADDCDDTRAATFTGALESCNRIDDDCSLTAGAGGVDPGEDADDDGHAAIAAACTGGLPRDDCRDTDSAIHPMALETCDRIDEDCSLTTGAGGVDPAEDADDDGHAPVGTVLCMGGPLAQDDCDDTAPNAHPGAAETCDGVDTDCDGVADGAAVSAASCTGGTRCIAGDCTTVLDISAGLGHTCLVTSIGRVMCWGANGPTGGPADGRLGVGDAPAIVRAPRVVPGITDALTVHAGGSHTCVRHRATNAVSCWGVNSDGQLGDGTTTLRTSPRVVAGLTVTTLDAGGRNTCAGTTSNTVVCWGDGTPSGQASDVSVPTLVAFPALTVVNDVSAGDVHSCAAVTSAVGDHIWCWGAATLGRLGNGIATGTFLTPQDIDVGGSVEAHEVGGCATRGIFRGAVSCWGDDGTGTLGDGAAPGPALTPRIVLGALDRVGIDRLSASGNHVCARRMSDGLTYCWGYGVFGQIGDGLMSNATLPAMIAGTPGTGSRTLAAGAQHTCVLTLGAVWCWGRNDSGQLGVDLAPAALMDRSTPVMVDL